MLKILNGEYERQFERLSDDPRCTIMMRAGHRYENVRLIKVRTDVTLMELPDDNGRTVTATVDTREVASVEITK